MNRGRPRIKSGQSRTECFLSIGQYDGSFHPEAQPRDSTVSPIELHSPHNVLGLFLLLQDGVHEVLQTGQSDGFG